MKKLIFALIFMAMISPVFANQPDVYYISVPVEKVWLAGEGYVVQYRRGNTQIGTIGIPYKWFSDAGAKAEIVNLPRGPNWPTMAVFYKDGEFSHVRLYVHRQKSHTTWGVTPQGADVSRWFPEADSLDMKF